MISNIENERTRSHSRASAYERAIASLVGQLALSRPLVVVDLETTGVSVEHDRIVQIGIVRVEPTGSHVEFNRLVNPGIPIPAGAAAVHGITDSMVADAPTFKILAPEVTALLSGADLGGYNVRRFDRRVLDAEYARIGAASPVKGAKIVDPFLIFVRREARTLSGAMRFYCRVPDFAGHRAIDDVKATLRVLAAQLAKYPDLPTTVDGLHDFGESRDPSWVDPDGRIVLRDGEAVMAFGKHAGRRLRDVVSVDGDYLAWILSKDFSPEVKGIVADTLHGLFPVAVEQYSASAHAATPHAPDTRLESVADGPHVDPGDPQGAAPPDDEDDDRWDVDNACLKDTDDPVAADVDDAVIADVDDAVLADIDDGDRGDVDHEMLGHVEDPPSPNGEDVVWTDVQDASSADFEKTSAQVPDPTDLPQLFRPRLWLVPLNDE